MLIISSLCLFPVPQFWTPCHVGQGKEDVLPHLLGSADSLELLLISWDFTSKNYFVRGVYWGPRVWGACIHIERGDAPDHD